MPTPEVEAPAPLPLPEAPPPGPPNPDMQAVDLLGQAFNMAGQLGQVVLAGQIGAGLSRMTSLINDKAVMQASLDAANKKWLQLDARAVAQDAEIEKLQARVAEAEAEATEMTGQAEHWRKLHSDLVGGGADAPTEELPPPA